MCARERERDTGLDESTRQRVGPLVPPRNFLSKRMSSAIPESSEGERRDFTDYFDDRPENRVPRRIIFSNAVSPLVSASRLPRPPRFCALRPLYRFAPKTTTKTTTIRSPSPPFHLRKTLSRKNKSCTSLEKRVFVRNSFEYVRRFAYLDVFSTSVRHLRCIRLNLISENER